jgi:hypothetical protein
MAKAITAPSNMRFTSKDGWLIIVMMMKFLKIIVVLKVL